MQCEGYFAAPPRLQKSLQKQLAEMSTPEVVSFYKKQEIDLNRDLLQTQLSTRASAELALVASLLEREGNKEVGSISFAKKVQGFLLQNAYIENQLTSLELLQWARGLSRGDDVQASLADFIIKKRRRHYQGIDVTLYGSYLEKPLESLRFFNQENIKVLKASLPSAELHPLRTAISHVWQRDFVGHNPQQVLAALEISLADYPEISVFIFQDIKKMNQVFYRSSLFQEGEQSFGKDLFGIHAAAFELEVASLRAFAAQNLQQPEWGFRQHQIRFLREQDRAEKKAMLAEYAERLNQESSFLNYIQDKMQTKAKVVIALPAARTSVLDWPTALVRAVFSVDTVFREAILAYYQKELTRADKNLFLAEAEWLALAASGDEVAMAKNYAAYVLVPKHFWRQMNEPQLAGLKEVSLKEGDALRKYLIERRVKIPLVD